MGQSQISLPSHELPMYNRMYLTNMCASMYKNLSIKTGHLGGRVNKCGQAGLNLNKFIQTCADTCLWLIHVVFICETVSIVADLTTACMCFFTLVPHSPTPASKLRTNCIANTLRCVSRCSLFVVAVPFNSERRHRRVCPQLTINNKVIRITLVSIWARNHNQTSDSSMSWMRCKILSLSLRTILFDITPNYPTIAQISC